MGGVGRQGGWQALVCTGFLFLVFTAGVFFDLRHRSNPKRVRNAQHWAIETGAGCQNSAHQSLLKIQLQMRWKPSAALARRRRQMLTRGGRHGDGDVLRPRHGLVLVLVVLVLVVRVGGDMNVF